MNLSRRNKLRWSEEDLVYLREYYPKATRQQMMRKLRRGWEGIASAASLHEISRPRRKGAFFYSNGKPRMKVLENDCWQWTGGLNKKGYPIARGANTTLVYRELYIQKFGAIPEGKTLDHTCKNRACVNIEHLELVPHIVNVRRSKRTVLSPETVEFIRANKSMRTCDLARQLNLSYNAVYFAQRGDSWKIL